VRALIAILLAGALLAASAAAGSEAGASDPACRWRVVLNAPGPELWSTAGLADGDLWAVGDNAVRSAILHWDGRRWRSFASPFFAFGVAALSGRDVWTVGSSLPGGLQTRPRAEHWDGRRWRAVEVPGQAGAYLRAVAALSPGDVWAAGARARGPLLEHWNGSAWHLSPGGPRDGVLQALAARSPQDVWAVGTQGMMTLGPQDEEPLIERFQHGRWRSLPARGLEWVNVNLFAVAAVSADDAWAVGAVDLQGGVPFAEHWDGSAWTAVPTSGLPTSEVFLSAVAAVGPDDVWVAGSRGFGPGERALLARWDGTGWSELRGPRGALNGLVALSPRDIWAVGGFQTGSRSSGSLIEHYLCGADAASNLPAPPSGK
jgi:hypothetical protein